MQLYNRGLTGAEVLQLASATGTMCVPPPVSYTVTLMPVGSGESGVPFTTQPTLAILDAAGNIVSNATTAITATASGGATLAGTTTVNAVNGIVTFTNLAINGAATTSITFTAPGLPISGSGATSAPMTTVQIARKLAITTQPGGVQTGLTLNPQPIIEVRDAANLKMPGATNVVTASVASGVGTLAGATTATAINAVATFTTLAVNGLGPVTLTFASPSLTSVTSNVMTVLPVPIVGTALGLVTPPSGAESGRPFTVQPVVEVRDATGARVTTATGTVTAAIASGTGTLVGTVTANIVNGVATFANLQFNGTGNVTLRFTSGTLTAATSPVLAVVQVVRQLAVIGGPTSIITGVIMAPPFSLELRDAAGIKVATAT